MLPGYELLVELFVGSGSLEGGNTTGRFNLRQSEHRTSRA